MTARAETTVLVDAAQVHAEGIASGLRTAVHLLRVSGQPVPVTLLRRVTEAEANACFFAWRAGEGRPVDFKRDDEVRALIHVVLAKAGVAVTHG